MIKNRLIALLAFLCASCSTAKMSYHTGDLVKIKHGKDVFRIIEPEYRKARVYANWNSLFYDVTHVKNGRHFSLPEKSLVLVQRKKTDQQESPRVIANDSEN